MLRREAGARDTSATRGGRIALLAALAIVLPAAGCSDNEEPAADGTPEVAAVENEERPQGPAGSKAERRRAGDSGRGGSGGGSAARSPEQVRETMQRLREARALRDQALEELRGERDPAVIRERLRRLRDELRGLVPEPDGTRRSGEWRERLGLDERERDDERREDRRRDDDRDDERD